jgi:hypothetical protein
VHEAAQDRPEGPFRMPSEQIFSNWALHGQIGDVGGRMDGLPRERGADGPSHHPIKRAQSCFIRLRIGTGRIAKVPRRGIPMIVREARKGPEVDKPKQAVLTRRAAWPGWCVGCAS